MTEIYLGLGTNLGDREANLARARELLAEAVKPLAASSVYESEPIGLSEQPLFLNQVAKGATELLPLDLLGFLKGIEGRMGRKPAIRNGPRLIDLDILLYGDWVMAGESLVIPHAGMLARSFVLAPLAEIAPALSHPVSGAAIGKIWQSTGPDLARSWPYHKEVPR